MQPSKPIITAAGVAMLASMLALPAVAQQTSPTSPPPASGSQSAPSQTQPREPSPSQPGQRQRSHDRIVASRFTAHVTGTVTAVDTQSGKLTLRGPEGDVNVRFPAAAVQQVKQGDTVTVAIGLMDQHAAASPGTSPGAGSQPGMTHAGSPNVPSPGSGISGGASSAGPSAGGATSGGASSGSTR
jgi:hypothetical protein